MADSDTGERRPSILWRVIRWYLLAVEILVVGLGVYLVSIGTGDDRSLGLFCLLLGGIALVSHIVAGVALRGRRRRP